MKAKPNNCQPVLSVRNVGKPEYTSLDSVSLSQILDLLLDMYIKYLKDHKPP